MRTHSTETYQVVIWDKSVDEPYYKLYYKDVEEAKLVARNLKRLYVDEAYELRSEKFPCEFEIKLHRLEGNNG